MSDPGPANISDPELRDVAAMFRFLNEIAIIAQLSGSAFEKVMPGTMTLPQFAVLNHLTRLGGNRTPAQIANALQVAKGTMTHTLGLLERSGWIVIRPDADDRRSKRVDLTETGRVAHRDAIAALSPELAWLSSVTVPERVRDATPLLEQIRAALDHRRG